MGTRLGALDKEDFILRPLGQLKKTEESYRQALILPKYEKACGSLMPDEYLCRLPSSHG